MITIDNIDRGGARMQVIGAKVCRLGRSWSLGAVADWKWKECRILVVPVVLSEDTRSFARRLPFKHPIDYRTWPKV
jgi:hypothetical protein